MEARVCDVLFVGRLSYCFKKSQAVGGRRLGGFMLCQVWEVLLQVSGSLAVQAVDGMLGLHSVPESRDAMLVAA